ncbi:hypothetical protein BpHYR1_054391 [Brachionus plicatilis]|uniref:Uncharacterized protein n=1 Tax=Brachionus plicatilis TaxID=10195 RepID=A0A3M7QIN0_BRAPC|nr:hypothetical protein BpHYR1_054391 [Brachionus plicatilis]
MNRIKILIKIREPIFVKNYPIFICNNHQRCLFILHHAKIWRMKEKKIFNLRVKILKAFKNRYIEKKVVETFVLLILYLFRAIAPSEFNIKLKE